MNPNTFFAHDAGIYSQKEFKKFLNCVSLPNIQTTLTTFLSKLVFMGLCENDLPKFSLIFQSNLLESVFMTVCLI